MKSLQGRYWPDSNVDSNHTFIKPVNSSAEAPHHTISRIGQGHDIDYLGGGGYHPRTHTKHFKDLRPDPIHVATQRTSMSPTLGVRRVGDDIAGGYQAHWTPYLYSCDCFRSFPHCSNSCAESSTEGSAFASVGRFGVVLVCLAGVAG